MPSTSKPTLNGAIQYMAAIQAILQQIEESQAAALDAAVTAIVEAFQTDGLLYLFGTGHSHLLAEEGHYRAGGLAPVCPILSSATMLHESAVTSTHFERTSGIGAALLERYPISDRDVIMIFSNSGVNTVPVEVALVARERGMTVIGVVAAAYSAKVPAGPSGYKLTDLAHIVIDNHGVPGDALIPIGADGRFRTGPSSTITGAFILNAILTEVAWRLDAMGVKPPIYISANMPGAAEHNAGLVARFRTRNPHL